MLFWITLACTPGNDDDSGSTNETGSTDDTASIVESGDTSDSDTNQDSGDTQDSAHTGDTQDSGLQTPTYTVVAGPTGIQIDMDYAGTPAAEDRVRYGLWLNRDAEDAPDLSGESTATFPQSLVVETTAGTWQVSTFYDVGGNNPTGPGAEDRSVRWESPEGIAYDVEVQEGYTTVGVYVTF